VNGELRKRLATADAVGVGKHET